MSKKMMMSKPTDPTLSLRIITQGQALVRAIEALEVIEPSGWLECGIIRFLVAGYKRRLRAIVGAVPSWMSDKILSASEGFKMARSMPSRN